MENLGLLLIENGICSTQQVADAIRQQVILGGRLGTNLVELGHLDESTLARYLAKLHGNPALFGDKLRPDPKALELLPRAIVDRLNVIPYRQRGDRLQVLCLNPKRLNAMEEVSANTGLKPDPIVVPEVRFWKLLDEFYKIHRGSRGLTLEELEVPIWAQAQVEAQATDPQNQRPTVTDDLMTEEAFDQLYQSDPTRAARPSGEGWRASAPSPAPPSDSPFAEPELPAAGPGSMYSDAAITTRVQLEGPDADLPLLSGDDLQEVVVGELLPSEQPPAYDIEHDGPIDFAQATKLLAEAGDRDQVARTVLRFAHSLFRRAMLYTVHRAWIIGWDAIGEEIDRLTFRKQVIRLDEASIFQTVVKSRAHYLGSLQKTPTNIQFLRETGKKVPLSAFLLPVLVQGRVVNIFYGDNGHKSHCSSDIGELLILALKISQSYEALFQAKWASEKPPD